MSAFLKVINAEGHAADEPSDSSEEAANEQNPEPKPLFAVILVNSSHARSTAGLARNLAGLISLRLLVA